MAATFVHNPFWAKLYCVLLHAGIDTSNIVEGGRRSRARVDYSAVLKSNAGEGSEDEDQASLGKWNENLVR